MKWADDPVVKAVERAWRRTAAPKPHRNPRLGSEALLNAMMCYFAESAR